DGPGDLAGDRGRPWAGSTGRSTGLGPGRLRHHPQDLLRDPHGHDRRGRGPGAGGERGMIEKFKAWARTHINRLFLGVPASLMVLGILGVVLTALPEDTEAHAQEVAGVKVELEQDRTEAQETLETEHRQLLD